MNAYTRDRILEIAENVRYWAESFAEDNDFDSDLCGMCAIASGQLFFKLKRAGFDPVLRIWYENGKKGEAHVYLMVEDYVLDVTATQFLDFSNQPIVFMHEAEACVYPYYNHTREYKTVQGLREHQRGARWPASQTTFDEELI